MHEPAPRMEAERSRVYVHDPRAHPGLRAIAVIEGIKGLLALSAASGLELIGPIPLKRWVHELITRFQLEPDHGAMAWLANAINPHSVHFAAAAVCLYGCCTWSKPGACGATRRGPRCSAASPRRSTCLSKSMS